MPIPRPIPVSASEVVRLFRYDPSTGVLYNRITRKKAKEGAIAGSLRLTSCGKYVQYVTVNGFTTPVHRLIWLYCYGFLPLVEIDHKDGYSSNNRIWNLRLCIDGGVNLHNLHQANRSNKLGLLGVSKKKNRNVFRAAIRPPGQDPIHLGCFSTPEEAHLVYLTAKNELHKFNTLPVP